MRSEKFVLGLADQARPSRLLARNRKIEAADNWSVCCLQMQGLADVPITFTCGLPAIPVPRISLGQLLTYVAMMWQFIQAEHAWHLGHLKMNINVRSM